MDTGQAFVPSPQDLAWLIAATVPIMVATVALRVFLMRRRGDFVFRPVLPGPRFSESWASGSAGFWAAARNCMWVTVTDDRVYIGLHFPFSVFVPRWLGLDARIVPADIVALENKDAFLQGRVLALRFRGHDGRPLEINLKLQREAEFVRSVKELCRDHGKVV